MCSEPVGSAAKGGPEPLAGKEGRLRKYHPSVFRVPLWCSRSLSNSHVLLLVSFHRDPDIRHTQFSPSLWCAFGEIRKRCPSLGGQIINTPMILSIPWVQLKSGPNVGPGPCPAVLVPAGSCGRASG